MTWKINNTIGEMRRDVGSGERTGKKDTGYLYKALWASSDAGQAQGPHPCSTPPLVPTHVALRNIFICCLVLLAIALSACNDQSQQVDPRLKYFVIVDSRVLIEGNNAEVFGEIENTSKMQFPFDVTMQADLMDINGQMVGTATGTAEDVGMGQVRQFMLVGTVDGTRYARLKVTPISLQEKRQELGWPTPTPISP